MPSEANLLCCGHFQNKVQAKHMGGTFVNTDIGRPLVFRSEVNNWEMKLPNGSWGDPGWHDYCLTPEGLYDGDVIYSEGFFVGNHDTIINEGLRAYFDGEEESFWEAIEVESRDGPITAGGSWGNPDDAYYDDEDDLREPNCPVELSRAYEGDLVEIQVERVLSDGIRFSSEFVEEDELVNRQRSIRIPRLVKKPSLPFLEGETITARVVDVSTTPPKKKKKTLDGRKYVFLFVEIVAWR